jgi:sortase A
MSKPNKRDKIDLFLKLSIAVMFIAGFLIFMYPFVVDSINNYVDQQRLEAVQEKMESRSESDKKKRLERLEKENKKLKTIIPGAGSFDDPFESSLRGTKSPKKEYYEKHMIGAVFIPKIQVSLPVYDETNDFTRNVFSCWWERNTFSDNRSYRLAREKAFYRPGAVEKERPFFLTY